MNERERLIELICEGTLKTEICTTETHLDCDICRGDCGYCTILADYLLANGVTVQRWIPASEPPEEHDSIWARLYGTKSWQPGLFRKCSYDVLACVEKKDGNRRVISIRTYDGKWDHNKLNEETVVCWQPMPEPPKEE